VLMYVRFPLSLRNVEDLLFERGIDLCHETVRLWWNRFGPIFAAEAGGGGSAGCAGSGIGAGILMRCSCGSTASAIICGGWSITRARSWRATSPKPRDKAAALAFLKKALKRHGRAEKIVTDGLRSYPAAMRQLGNFDRREMGGWLNNRAENSHLPFRRRERAMLRFRQMKALQKFASVHASLHNHFGSERHLLDRQTYKQRRSAALAEWRALAA